MFETLWRWMKSVNKKVWVTAAFLAVIFLSGMTWIIVANALGAFKAATMLSEEERQTVSGNGGPAVMVGDWLYFVGGYVDSSKILYRQNEHNKVKEGAIYRVYIDPALGEPLYEDSEKKHSNPDYTTHLLSEEKLGTGEKVDPRKFQLVVPKVAGFDQAALWVFDKYLIYTSPNNTKDKTGQLQLSKIDFFRVGLDGKDHRKIYTTSNEMVTTNDFTVASYDSEVYILIKDGDTLRRVGVTKNPGKVETISEKVQSVALPIVTSYADVRKSYEGIMNYVYYTEALSEEEQEIGLLGNRVFQYRVSNGTSNSARINDRTIELKALSNGRLLYTVSTAPGSQLSGSERLGLFGTTLPIPTANCFDINFLNNYKLLDSHNFQPSEVIYLPTVNTPNTVFRFVTLAEGNMYIYEEDKLGELPKRIVDVSKIITITGDTVHYLNSGGEIKAIHFIGGQVNLGSAQPETLIRPWVVTRKNVQWYFHIKTLEQQQQHDHEHDDDCDHGSGSTTVAALYDLSNGKVREFLLGRLDCMYIQGHDDNC